MNVVQRTVNRLFSIGSDEMNDEQLKQLASFAHAVSSGIGLALTAHGLLSPKGDWKYLATAAVVLSVGQITAEAPLSRIRG